MNEPEKDPPQETIDKVAGWLLLITDWRRMLVFGVIVAVIVLGLAAIAKYNPVADVGTAVGEPVAKSVGLIQPKCPSGWDYEGPVQDEHAVTSPRCIDDPWIVFLVPNSLNCSYGFNTKGSGADTPCEQVPGWPK